MEAIIEIKKLSKQYKNAAFFSVTDISLQIQSHEIYGILGPNGAGKTTLISMLSGLVQPTSGSYLIDGLSPAKNRNRIQKMMGVVPQEYALYPTLTATENLYFFGSMYGLNDATLKKTVPEMLDRMGLAKFAHKKIEHFSGGMKRRCNLLSGTLHNPKILILDEPTVGVDVHSKKAIIDYLKELNANGTCILYTSHHLSEAEEFCTKIAIMDNGQIFASGSPQDLIAQTENAKNLEEVFIQLTGQELRDVI